MRSYRELYACHKFVGRLPQREQIISLHCAGTDLFLDAIVLDAAHVEGRPTLAELLEGQTSIELWLLPRSASRNVPEELQKGIVARVITVTFSRLVPVPVDFDAQVDGVALDRVLLMSPTYFKVDRPATDWPIEVRSSVSPQWLVRGEVEEG